MIRNRTPVMCSSPYCAVQHRRSPQSAGFERKVNAVKAARIIGWTAAITLDQVGGGGG